VSCVPTRLRVKRFCPALYLIAASQQQRNQGRKQLTATTGAERADAVFLVLAADGSRHAIAIRVKNIVASRTNDNIFSLAVLLKTLYKVNFRVCADPTDVVGDLYTPKAKRIALVFSGNPWRLPMWSSTSRCESTSGIPAHQNPFAALLNIPENVACTRDASQPNHLRRLLSSCLLQITYACAET
jgi:hypothetical protein